MLAIHTWNRSTAATTPFTLTPSSAPALTSCTIAAVFASGGSPEGNGRSRSRWSRQLLTAQGQKPSE